MTWLPRTLGVLTATYGISTLVRPSLLTGPAGLSVGEPPAPMGVLVRAIGARDLANGLAMATAPTGSALRLAILARVVSDLGDAVTFALAPGEASTKKKTVGVAVGWAALNVVGLLAARRAP